jgi:Uma2 family endonuclease
MVSFESMVDLARLGAERIRPLKRAEYDRLVELGTVSRDRSEKLLLYAQNGVLEYWIADYRLRRSSVWTRDEQNRLTGPTVHEADARVPSKVLPGLDLSLDRVFE